MKIMIESATGCFFILCPLTSQMETLEIEFWQFGTAIKTRNHSGFVNSFYLFIYLFWWGNLASANSETNYATCEDR